METWKRKTMRTMDLNKSHESLKRMEDCTISVTVPVISIVPLSKSTMRIKSRDRNGRSMHCDIVHMYLILQHLPRPRKTR